MKYDLPDELQVSGEGPIRVLTMNRPEKLNSVNQGLHLAMGNVWQQLRQDPDLKVVVLTGAGRAFSAGGDMDLLERTAKDHEFRYQSMADAQRIINEMLAFPYPVIAAVNGPAVGLGCSAAVLCDIVLASDRAFFADPHVSVGLVAADGGALVWPMLMGALRAKEYLFTGDRIDAELAVQLGLANRVVPHDELLPEAITLAERLARQPQQALMDTKRSVNLHLQRAVSGVIDFAFAAEAQTFGLPGFLPHLENYRPDAKRS